MRFRWWVFISAFLFLAGFFWGLSVSGTGSDVLSGNIEALENMAGIIPSLSSPALFAFILIKNISAVVFSLLLSPVLLLVPVVALVLNGGILGLVSVIVSEQQSLGVVLAGLLPHGVFEIPALIIGEAVALKTGFGLIMAVFSREKREQLLPEFRKDSRWLAVTAGLLVVAAAVEAFITPRLLG